MDYEEFIELLFRAAESRNYKKIENYIEQGGDVNIMNRRGETLLMYAAAHGELEMCQILVACGARVNTSSEYQEMTALMMAAMNSHFGVYDFLIHVGADACMLDFLGNDAYYYAIKI